jgi:hypothetical protein
MARDTVPFAFLRFSAFVAKQAPGKDLKFKLKETDMLELR